MKLSEDGETITLKAKVIGGMIPQAIYIRDDLNSGCYPGMLKNYGVNWEVGDELEIVIRRVKHGRDD